MSQQDQEFYQRIKNACTRKHQEYLKTIRLSFPNGPTLKNSDFDPVLHKIYLSICNGDFYDSHEFSKKINQASNIACDVVNHGQNLTQDQVLKIKKTIQEIYQRVSNVCILAELMTTDFEGIKGKEDIKVVLLNLLLKRDPTIENPHDAADELIRLSEKMHQPEFSETTETLKEPLMDLILKTFGTNADSEAIIDFLTKTES